MPQIAQQDYIRINVEEYFPGLGLDELQGATMPREFWDVIENHRKRGSLMDVILSDSLGSESKIVGYVFSDEFNECSEINYVYGVIRRLQRPE